MQPWSDPSDPKNGSQHHTGLPCIEDGCQEPAGTAWSPHWCQRHNAERIRRISGQLDAIIERYLAQVEASEQE